MVCKPPSRSDRARLTIDRIRRSAAALRTKAPASCPSIRSATAFLQRRNVLNERCHRVKLGTEVYERCPNMTRGLPRRLAALAPEPNHLSKGPLQAALPPRSRVELGVFGQSHRVAAAPSVASLSRMTMASNRLPQPDLCGEAANIIARRTMARRTSLPGAWQSQIGNRKSGYEPVIRMSARPVAPLLFTRTHVFGHGTPIRNR